jgi:uncharacterized protein involved in exopolysaccharide biosynthesis
MSPFDVFGLSAAGWRARFLGLWHAALGWMSARPLAAGSVVLLGAVVGLAVNYVVGPRRFAATAGISVSSNPGIELPSALTSLAASTGLRLGSTTLPLAFQSDILASAPFQDSVLLVPDAAVCGSRRCRLLEALEADSGVLTVRLAHARRTLNKRLDVVRDERSRVITIAYRDPDSTLARAVVATTVVVLDNTNKRLTSTAADAKVEFLSSQLPFLQRQLQAIQDSLEAFYTSNRLFENSPSLRFREQRLRGQYDSQLRLLESVREQLATSELQTRGGVQVVQTVMPVSVDPKPVRPLRNLALVLGMVLAALTGIALWNGSVRPH